MRAIERGTAGQRKRRAVPCHHHAPSVAQNFKDLERQTPPFIFIYCLPTRSGVESSFSFIYWNETVPTKSGGFDTRCRIILSYRGH